MFVPAQAPSLLAIDCILRDGERRTGLMWKLKVNRIYLLICSLGLIAFQEIAKKEALQKICEELNNPTLPSISKWKGAKGHWEYHISPSPTGRMFQGVEYNGFLYDTEQEVSLLSAALIENSDSSEKSFVRKPFVGHFNVSSSHRSK